MSGRRRGWMLLAMLVASMGAWLPTAVAQIAMTTVQDTVYSANGSPASGTVLVSWGAFTTANGQSVAAGSTSVTLGAGGSLTIALAPNAGSTPLGTYYTAVFHLSDGTTSREYWVVPATVAGGGPATLAAIKSQVLPVSVAMQTVSKQYVDNAIAAAVTGSSISSSTYVLTAGSAMTGPLGLPGDPVSPNQAADKHYVDANISSVSAGLNQKVSVLPTATQTVTQPSGTNFGISGASSATTFTGSGIYNQTSITATTAAANPGQNSYIQHANNMNCFQQGFNLGNNGTSAQGWSTCALYNDVFKSAERGISQLHAGQFSHMGQGDTAAFYTYLAAFGGNVASSDEAVTHTVNQTHQVGYYSGPIASGGTTGSNLVVASSMTCNGFCLALANSGQTFADGGILFDKSKVGSTATIATTGRAMNGLYYTLATGAVTPSTAWGNIVPSSCTNNGNGQNQVYTTTTCNVTLGTSPASPGSFVAGQDIFLSGPFEEEAAVTAVGVASGGVQSVTFNTRYAWNVASNAALVMQGGPGGQSFIATDGAWPVAYAVVGATSSTQIFFSNCLTGGCNGGGNIIPAPLTQGGSPVNLTRAANVVTMTSGNPFLFPTASSLVVTGCNLSDLNGTFTVAASSEDGLNSSVTWNQTGVNETGAGCTISQAPPSITFYPSAFITGVDSGVYGGAQLATNTVAWTNGDTIVGAPTSQYQQAGLIIYEGQNTATTGSNASIGVLVDDNGPSQLTHAYQAFNSPGNGVGLDMFNIQGSYGTILNMGYRPANNGTILYVGGGEPVTSTPKPYFIFQDNQDNAAKFGFDPLNHYFTMNGPLHIGTGTVCTSNNAACGAGSSGVTSVGAGVWPSWLTPTVTNATTTPSLAVAASAIPNAALANSATTVNGQTCALGSTCTAADSTKLPLTGGTLTGALGINTAAKQTSQFLVGAAGVGGTFRVDTTGDGTPTTLDGCFGTYEAAGGVYYGICGQGPPPAGWIAMTGWYSGMGIAANVAAGSSSYPIFGVNTSNQGGGAHGVGGNMFNVQVNKVVTTYNSTLDDGNGNMKIPGVVTMLLEERSVGSSIASASTIAPANSIAHLTGTAAIATITPPTGMSATVGGCLTLIADGAWSTTTTGNIFTAMTASAGVPYQACYDGSKWYLK